MFFNFPFGPGHSHGSGPNVFFDTGDFEEDFPSMDQGETNTDKDYYKILGVDEKATEDEIKKAYRRLSMLHHPDKNGNTEESKQMFQELNNAYATLSDTNKRRSYDMTRKFGGGGAVGGGGGMPGFQPNVFQFGGAGGAGIPEEILHMLFGNSGLGGMGGMGGMGGLGGMGGGLGQGPKVVFQAFHNGRPMGGQHHQQQQHQPQPHVRVYQVPETIIKTVSLTLEQCYNGCSVPLEIDRHVPDNDIVKIERETIHAQIPKGVQSGETIILNGCGHMNEVGVKGDVQIIINTLQHPVFKVEHLDLLVEKTISLKSALCGFDFEINHINGRVFKLANKPGNIIKPGSVKTIPGLGLEKNGETGSLKIRFNVEFPETLTPEQINTLQSGL
jgi:DnaJ-class molecular chaperone